MNSDLGNHLRCERWGIVAFYCFCLSTVFMIFFSTSALQTWPYPWNRLSILLASLLPLSLVLVWKMPHLIRNSVLEKKFLFVPIIIIFGILNILFSENRPGGRRFVLDSLSQCGVRLLEMIHR